MKRLILALVLIAFTTSTAAVVGQNSTGDGPHILGAGSSSSASASAATGPNGTEWRAEVAMVNRSDNYTENMVSEGDFSTADNISRVKFGGRIRAATPCHVIDHEVEETGNNTYTMNVKTVRDETDLDNQSICIQQAVMINYAASFEQEEPFQLQVQHDNQTIRYLTHPEFENEKAPREEPEKKGLIEKFMDWVSGIF